MELLRKVERKEAYAADITYGTNNEFGFDYLRDNMVIDQSQRVQRELVYAIVDEVDNILIDEARTPLIISAAAEESAKEYQTLRTHCPRPPRRRRLHHRREAPLGLPNGRGYEQSRAAYQGKEPL